MTIPANFAQVNLKFTGDSIPTGAQVTFGVAADVITDPELIAEEVVSLLGSTGALAPLSQTLNLSTVLVKVGPDETGPSAEIPTEIGGGTAGNVTPPNTSILVRKNTSLGGRHGQGRMFLPGVIETVVGDGGVLDTTFRNGLQSDWNDFLAALLLSEITMCLLHSDETAPTVVTSLAVQAVAATQRRRLRR